MEQKKDYKKPQSKEIEMKYEAPLMTEGTGGGGGDGMGF